MVTVGFKKKKDRLISVQRQLLFRRVSDQVLKVVESCDDNKDPDEEATVDAVSILEQKIAEMSTKHSELGGELVWLVDVQEPAETFAGSSQQPTPAEARNTSSTQSPLGLLTSPK